MNIFIYYLVCSSTLFMYKCKRVKINRIIAANSVLLNWTEHSTYLHLPKCNFIKPFKNYIQLKGTTCISSHT